MAENYGNIEGDKWMNWKERNDVMFQDTVDYSYHH